MPSSPTQQEETQSTGVPEAAVEKASTALCESVPPDLELVGGTWIEDPLADEWADWAVVALAAAYPAILADLKEKLEAEAAKLEREADEASETPTIASVKRIQAETIRKAFKAATEGHQ